MSADAARRAPQSAAAPVALPADRRLRVPLGLPHRRARGTGRRDRLALRARLRRAERLRQPARPPGGVLPARRRSASTIPPRALRAGNQRARDDVEDADRLDRRPRRADHRAAGARGHGHAPHAAAGRRRRRPHARAHRRVPRGPGRGRARLRARVRLRPRRRRSGRSSADDRHAADATGAGQTIRLRSDLALGIEGGRVRGRHALEPGDRAYCALSWAEGSPRPGTSTTPRRGSPRRRASGAPGSAGRASPTTASATRSSARRWRSRA